MKPVTASLKKTVSFTSLATLLVLTGISFVLGYLPASQLIMMLALVVTLIKGHVIVDYFMGLRHCQPLWRIVMNGYLVLIGSLIAIAYFIS